MIHQWEFPFLKEKSVFVQKDQNHEWKMFAKTKIIFKIN